MVAAPFAVIEPDVPITIESTEADRIRRPVCGTLLAYDAVAGEKVILVAALAVVANDEVSA